MDFSNDQTSPTSETFDKDFNTGGHFEGNIFKQPINVTEAYIGDHPIDGQTVYLTYEDPLKQVYKVEFQPFEMKGPLHFVEPHYVKGYHRVDGTYVDGYFRDGDGNTSIDRTAEQGGGYYSRS